MITFIKLADNKEVWLNFREKSVCIQSCETLKKEEIKTVIDFCRNTIDELKYSYTASREYMCGELYLHTILARLGILTIYTKDADIDYDKDSRWYVRLFSNIFAIFFK